MQITHEQTRNLIKKFNTWLYIRRDECCLKYMEMNDKKNIFSSLS